MEQSVEILQAVFLWSKDTPKTKSDADRHHIKTKQQPLKAATNGWHLSQHQKE